VLRTPLGGTGGGKSGLSLRGLLGESRVPTIAEKPWESQDEGGGLSNGRFMLGGGVWLEESNEEKRAKAKDEAGRQISNLRRRDFREVCPLK